MPGKWKSREGRFFYIIPLLVLVLFTATTTVAAAATATVATGTIALRQKGQKKTTKRINWSSF